FQAEDGIRDRNVTGVQTCALPIYLFLLDPPRSGAGGKVMRRIGRAQPDRVVYVSCNPKSFAEDIKELAQFGYRLEQVQPVDLFPQTYHVELVALMSRVEE